MSLDSLDVFGFQKTSFVGQKIYPHFWAHLAPGPSRLDHNDGVSPRCLPSEICIFENLHFMLINAEPLC